MEQNMRESQRLESKQNSKCGEYIQPFKGRDTHEELMKGAPKNSTKLYYPGYSFVPPSGWDVPQKRPPVCIPEYKRLPAGVFDRGTPTNVLEFNENGNIAVSEANVKYTNVGSIVPKFRYTELPEDVSNHSSNSVN